ncbi:MAG: hypothetical protein COU69_02210 [Candidatus Pacebacteria bacterium CG10_big_fil_rev_8_21_14_0_10_56_10]|nr:MAG: hypothetical protein COU69_02210 [Candidatus Pacebacteria bacterium CG10_big_fil_rev_8_21_14_0_10_56_10]
MVDTTKHLYILPDVAYLVELLPTKKEHTFTIHNFRQINGDFITQDVFVEDNVAKLFGKVDPDEYRLVLPDFLFTSVIVEVTETADTKIASYVDDHLLPSLTLTKGSHHIITQTLTQYGHKSRLQLSAIEKGVLNPIAAAHRDTDTKITGISPLSWMLKSSVSLEPSVTIAQLGGYVYLALQYIGVDQTNFALVEEADKLVETIKTLKGAEPSLQTVYLLTNELVEERLTEQLSDTLPVQQLVSGKSSDEKLPTYVQRIIEAGAKTSSVGDYHLPVFPVGKPVEDSQAPVVTSADRKAVSENVTDDDVSQAADSPLPPPSVLPTDQPDTDQDAEEMTEADRDAADTSSTAGADDSSDEDEAGEARLDKSVAKSDKDVVEQQVETSGKKAGDQVKTEADEVAESKADQPAPPSTTAPAPDDKEELVDEELQDEELSQFAPSHDEPGRGGAEPASKRDRSSADRGDQGDRAEHGAGQQRPAKPVIKNQPGISSMLKMIFISLGVFFATIAIGIGLGLVVISLSQGSVNLPSSFNPFSGDQTVDQTTDQPALPTPEPSPEPEPEPPPSPVNKAELSILVVNATTEPGLAGQNRDKLRDAEFGTVAAGNAQGTYDQGLFVLMAKENQALIDELEAALDLELEFSDQVSQEDSGGKYDAVVVIAE